MSCKVDGCNNAQYAFNLCNKHYKAKRRYGNPLGGVRPHGSVEDRFWSKVQKTQACWMWMGGISKTGYGILSAGAKSDGNIAAHRFSYQLHKGPIPDGLWVLHSCDNRWCVNPDHLRAGTPSENTKEAVDKGRKFVPNASGEANPKSKLTLEQAMFIKANPQYQHTYLAKLFGVSPNCIRGVRIGRTWK